MNRGEWTRFWACGVLWSLHVTSENMLSDRNIKWINQTMLWLLRFMSWTHKLISLHPIRSSFNYWKASEFPLSILGHTLSIGWIHSKMALKEWKNQWENTTFSLFRVLFLFTRECCSFFSVHSGLYVVEEFRKHVFRIARNNRIWMTANVINVHPIYTITI